MPCLGSRVGTAHTSGLPLASGGSAPVSHGDRGLLAPAAVYEHSASLRPHGASSSADAVSLGTAQQQDWVRQSVLGPSGVGLTAAPEILAKAEEAAQTVGVDELAALTPEELADHLLQLKREFRQIYSSILNNDALQSREGMTAAASLLDCCFVVCRLACCMCKAPPWVLVSPALLGMLRVSNRLSACSCSLAVLSCLCSKRS